jgi:hypothetical protein
MPARSAEITRICGQKSRFPNLTKLYYFGKVTVSPFFHLRIACERKKKSSCGQAAPMQGSPNQGIGAKPRDSEPAASNLLVVRVGRVQRRNRTTGRMPDTRAPAMRGRGPQRDVINLAPLRVPAGPRWYPSGLPVRGLPARASLICGRIGLWVARVRRRDHSRVMASRRPASDIGKLERDRLRGGGI